MKNNNDELVKFCRTLKCDCGRIYEVYDIKVVEKPKQYISNVIQLNCTCDSWRKINIRVNNY